MCVYCYGGGISQDAIICNGMYYVYIFIVQMQTIVCDACETGDKRYSVKMFIDSTERSLDERILHAIQSLHKFMSIIV